MCPEAIRRELANRLSQLLSRSGNGQDRDGNAIVDVSLNVLAALLVTAVNNQVIDDLVGDDLEGALAANGVAEGERVLRAWTAVAQALLAGNEFLFVR